MKKLLIISAILLITFAVFAQDHFNQRMDCQKNQGREKGRMGMMDKGRMEKGRPGEKMMMIMHALDLTEEQQDQMEAQRVKIRKTEIDIKAQIKTLEVDAEVAAKDMNFSQMKKISSDIFDLKKELKLKHIDNQEKCWNILTAEQKEKAMDLKRHPRKMMQKDMDGQGQKMGMGIHRDRMMDEDED